MTDTQTKKYDFVPLPQITERPKTMTTDDRLAQALDVLLITPIPIYHSQKSSMSKMVILSLVGSVLALTGSIALDSYIIYLIITKPFPIIELSCLVILSLSHFLFTYFTYSTSCKLRRDSSI